MSSDILLLNKVQLDDGSAGIVRYIGCIEGKKGVFYGIDLTKGDAKNNGSFKKIQYFNTKKGTKTGRFVPKSKILKNKKTTNSKYPFTFGDTVHCTKTKCKGIVRYVGIPTFVGTKKVYYGLELKKKKGEHNGTVKGVTYFKCKPQYGIYIQSSKVKAIKTKTDKDDNKEDIDDVDDAIRDYYKNKSSPNDNIKANKKKNNNNNTKQKIKAKPKPSTSTTKDTPSPLDQSRSKSVSASVDYMEEEKDLDFESYTTKNEQIDENKEETDRRKKIAIMKAMERQDRLEKQRKLKEENEKEQRNDEVTEMMNDISYDMKQKDIERKEKELRDKERLEKYRQKIMEKEEREKEEQKNKFEIEQRQKENERIKKLEMDEKRKKQEELEKERENERKLVQQLQMKKQQKINEEKNKEEDSENDGGYDENEDEKEEKIEKPKNGTSAFSAAMNKFNDNNKKKKNMKSDANYGNVKNVYSSRELNDELTKSIGKPLQTLNMIQLDRYDGEIPLILHMLGLKLSAINEWNHDGMFNPEKVVMYKDKPVIIIANNIYVFFSKLPTPLLHKIDQQILNKAISKDAMSGVVDEMPSPYDAVIVWLWDILAKVAKYEEDNGGMGPNRLGRVWGPLVTMVTRGDAKGNRISLNVLAASRMMAFFRRGIEWRMEVLENSI